MNVVGGWPNTLHSSPPPLPPPLQTPLTQSLSESPSLFCCWLLLVLNTKLVVGDDRCELIFRDGIEYNFSKCTHRFKIFKLVNTSEKLRGYRVTDERV